MVLGLYGAGGFGKETYEIASQYESDKWDDIVFIDDVTTEKQLLGRKILSYSDFRSEYPNTLARITITQGEPINKKILYERIKEDNYELASIIHPHSYVCPDVELDEGVIVFVGATISSTVHIGKCSSVLSYSLIGHDSHIGNFSQISAMVLINGHARIGDEVFVGGASCIRDNILVGSRSIIDVISCFAVKLLPLPDTPKIKELPFNNLLLSAIIIFLDITF